MGSGGLLGVGRETVDVAADQIFYLGDLVRCKGLVLVNLDLGSAEKDQALRLHLVR